MMMTDTGIPKILPLPDKIERRGQADDRAHVGHQVDDSPEDVGNRHCHDESRYVKGIDEKRVDGTAAHAGGNAGRDRDGHGNPRYHELCKHDAHQRHDRSDRQVEVPAGDDDAEARPHDDRDGDLPQDVEQVVAAQKGGRQKRHNHALTSDNQRGFVAFCQGHHLNNF